MQSDARYEKKCEIELEKRYVLEKVKITCQELKRMEGFRMEGTQIDNEYFNNRKKDMQREWIYTEG